VTDLACAPYARGIELTWKNGSDAYDSIQISRNGEAIGTALGLAESFLDPEVSPGDYAYEVVAVLDGFSAEAVGCAVTRPVWPVENLQCLPQGVSVRLVWEAVVAYTQVRISRDGTLIATVVSGEREFTDTVSGAGSFTYEVVGAVDAAVSPPAACTVDVASSNVPFIRGDANGDGIVNLADPVFSLSYIFKGGREPPCMEAANANDDAELNLADVIYNIDYIFREMSAPPAPFPACGVDPNPGTSLGCAVYLTCN
jgi:hypothetical protein